MKTKAMFSALLVITLVFSTTIAGVGVKEARNFTAESGEISSHGTVYTIRPDADGTFLDNVGTYADWDEAVQNNDTDYVATSPQLTGLRPDADGAFTEWSGGYEDWNDVTSDDDATYVVTPSQVTLRPDADGTFTQWTGGYDDWNDVTPDDDSTYVTTIATGVYQSSTIQDSGETWDIANVAVTYVAKWLGGIRQARAYPVVVIGGSPYQVAAIYLTSTYAAYSGSWETNPSTGQAWTWSQINALEAGVVSSMTIPDMFEIRVTQLYVTVTRKASQSSTIQNPVGQTWDIGSVVVTAVARTDGNARLGLMLVVGGTKYLGAEHELSTTYSSYTGDWPTNPDTGQAWTWSQINALEAGVTTIAIRAPGEIRVTQLYVSVTPRMYHSSELEDIGTGTATISTVKVVAPAKKTADEAFSFTPVLVIGGSTFAREEFSKWLFTLTTDYAQYEVSWNLNPATGLQWTWSDVNNLEAGVESHIGGEYTGEVRTTQLYVEVWLTSAAMKPPSVYPSSPFNVNVTVRDVFELFVFEFTLSFSPSILECLDAVEPYPPADQIWAFSIETIDNVAGTVHVVGGRPTGIKEGLSGTYALATLEFNNLGPGTSDLHFTISGLMTTPAMPAEPPRPDIDIYHDKEDGYFSSLAGDLDGNGAVDLPDLYIVIWAYGASPGEEYWDPRADLNGDDTVDIFDLVVVAINYGNTY